MLEEWKNIRGTENYAVSTRGRFRSNRYDRILKPQTIAGGVINVHYQIGKRTFSRQLAHLVVEAFVVGPKIHVRRVRHKDGDLTNCRFDNLEPISWTVW